MAQLFLIVGGSIFVVLGFLHALYTFLDLSEPRRLVPKDRALIDQMRAAPLRLSRGGTNMWSAWVGFNFSHSIGVILVGAIGICSGVYLRQLSPAVLGIPVLLGSLFLVLAIRYWFWIPALGAGIATAFFLLASLVVLL